MSERKEGWYWVKVTDNWEPAYFDGLEFELDHGPIAKMGPRIPTPDEPWQCVPKEWLKNLRASISGDCYMGEEWELATIDSMLKC